MSGTITASASVLTSCSSVKPEVKYELSSSSTVLYGATLKITATYTGEHIKGEVFQWQGFTEGDNNGIDFSLSEADDKSVLTITNSNSLDEDKIFTNIAIGYNGKATNVKHITCKEQYTVITTSVTAPTSINWDESLVITVSATHNHNNFTWKNIDNDDNVEFDLSNSSGVNDVLTIINKNTTNSPIILTGIKVSSNGTESTIATITLYPQATAITLGYSIPAETGNITIPFGGQLIITANSSNLVGNCDWYKPGNGNGITYAVTGSNHEILTITNYKSGTEAVLPSDLIHVTNNGTTVNVENTITLPIIEIELGYSIPADAGNNITVPVGGELVITAGSSHYVGDCVWNHPGSANGITYVEGGDNNKTLTIHNNNTSSAVILPSNEIDVTNNGTTVTVTDTITLPEPVTVINLSCDIVLDDGYIKIPHGQDLVITATSTHFVGDCSWTYPPLVMELHIR